MPKRYLGGKYPNQWYRVINNRRYCGVASCDIHSHVLVEDCADCVCRYCQRMMCFFHLNPVHNLCSECMTEDDGIPQRLMEMRSMWGRD